MEQHPVAKQCGSKEVSPADNQIVDRANNKSENTADKNSADTQHEQGVSSETAAKNGGDLKPNCLAESNGKPRRLDFNAIFQEVRRDNLEMTQAQLDAKYPFLKDFPPARPVDSATAMAALKEILRESEEDTD